jgi:carbamoyltransferase
LFILGLSFDYHDSAAALLHDGKIVAAAQEERFTRKKHDAGFPTRSIAYCLAEAGIGLQDIDAVVYYEDTLLKLDRIISSAVQRFGENPGYLSKVSEMWAMEGKFLPERRILRSLSIDPSKLFKIGHHEAHAAAAFLCSPFHEAAVVTLDGVGEYDTCSVSVGRDRSFELKYAARLPHSIGLLYSAFTAFLGFEVNEGEYKVMGMAGFGEPRFADEVRRLITLTDDGLFEIDQTCFEFLAPKDRPYTQALLDRFGVPREPESAFRPGNRNIAALPGSVEALSRHYADIAASVQLVAEEALLHIVRHAIRHTGLNDVCIAGGVGLNSLANARIQRELGCRLFVQPAAGDSGSALGAALHHYHSVLGRPRLGGLENAYLGRAYSDIEIEREVARHRLSVTRFASDQEMVEAVARLLHQGQVVGWMQGRFEWGPRALGSRSILANPTRADMQEIVNVKIKFREPFRPFAPSVLAEKAHLYYEFPQPYGPSAPEHFMLAVARVKEGQQDKIPATTHVDGTARLQLVRRETNPLYHDLIAAFERLSGVPVVMNTSFNLRGQPIVDKPYDALETFAWSGMDALVMNRVLVTKESLACAWR